MFSEIRELREVDSKAAADARRAEWLRSLQAALRDALERELERTHASNKGRR